MKAQPWRRQKSVATEPSDVRKVAVGELVSGKTSLMTVFFVRLTTKNVYFVRFALSLYPNKKHKTMKKVITILFVMVFIPTFMMADGYKKMWDRVEEAREKICRRRRWKN